MIRSENGPSLRTRCVHFFNNGDEHCKIGDWGIFSPMARSIQQWLTRQEYERSWTYQGACPGFKYDGGRADAMTNSERAALREILGL